MKIPNNILSYVSDEKIVNYLLNDIHPIGKDKAHFFKRFGFDLTDIDIFRRSLIQHSVDRDIEISENSNYGTKYELKCEIETPDKRNPCVITVWIVENEERNPRLITAYPAT